MEIDLKTDSRKVKPGDTFIAIRNVNRDGHDYIPQAIKNGATKKNKQSHCIFER